MEYIFDRDTCVERIGEGNYQATVTDRWNIAVFPNGGYLLALCARALLDATERPDVLTATAHFLRPLKPGPVDVVVEPIKVGKAVTYAQARLRQADVDCMQVTAALGDFSTRSGMNFNREPVADIAAIDECIAVPMPFNFHEQVKLKLTPESAKWTRNEFIDDCALMGWGQFADDRPIDALSMLMFGDCFPPPMFSQIGATGWVPTVELTVHLHARPEPGPLRIRQTARQITEGVATEDCDLWDTNGTLVATARQLAIVRTAG